MEKDIRKIIFLKEKLPNVKINESNSELEDSSFYDPPTKETKTLHWKLSMKHFKIFILVLIWAVCSFALMFNRVTVQDMHQISIPHRVAKNYIIPKKANRDTMEVTLQGAFVPPCYGNMSENWLSAWVQLIVVKELPVNSSNIKDSDMVLIQNVSEVWNVPLVIEKLIGVVPEVEYKKTFRLATYQIDNTSYNVLRVKFRTNLNTTLPVSLAYNLEPINTDVGIIYALLILVGLYVLIIFDIIHRTLAAMMASTLSVAVLAALNARPTLDEIISWIDVETLLLLFSMMTLVTILGETGIFEYTSVVAYRLTGGRVWPLVNSICVITAVLSSFLDNVTTALLTTPVIIRLCEVLKLNPVPIIMISLLFNNIGGAITPIGDPPNVIIASNKAVLESGVNFGVFTLHMGIGSLIVLIVVYLQLRLTLRDDSRLKNCEPVEVEELKREIAVWQRTAASMSSYSKDEETVKVTLIKASEHLQDKLKLAVNNISGTEENYTTNLKDLEKQYPIRDKVLLVKCSIVLSLVICVFFLHSIPALSLLGLGWTALLGALLLLVLYDKEDIEGIFARIEWSTLLFFASLFILMEALARLGLIEWIGLQTQNVIMSVGPESRLAVAIILILWVSAFVSAFVDNLPLTTMMIRIATNLSENRELNLPLQALVWSLSFGACLGGNGSLFGSSSNIVCAGVAEQHGYRITLVQFFKLGFPVMITSLLVTTVYLIICHVVLTWH